MVFRDDLAAAHARIAALERELRELRADNDRLRGRAPLDTPLPVVRGAGDSRWLAGRVLGWSPTRQRLAYVGGTDADAVVRILELGRPALFECPVAGDTRDPARLYTVDGMAVVRNFGLGEPDLTVAVEAANGGEVFRIVDAFGDARFHGADGVIAAL